MIIDHNAETLFHAFINDVIVHEVLQNDSLMYERVVSEIIADAKINDILKCKIEMSLKHDDTPAEAKLKAEAQKFSDGWVVVLRDSEGLSVSSGQSPMSYLMTWGTKKQKAAVRAAWKIKSVLDTLTTG